MAEDTPLISEKDWELSPADEREILLRQFCKQAHVQQIGEELGLNWFNKNHVDLIS